MFVLKLSGIQILFQGWYENSLLWLGLLTKFALFISLFYDNFAFREYLHFAIEFEIVFVV